MTNPMQEDVLIFHQTYGQPTPEKPQMLPQVRKNLRLGLITEELKELGQALADDDVVETVDVAIDILYVTFGLLVEMGIDAQPLFDEVQHSNLSKLGADGKPILSRGVELDGFPVDKVLKGPNYFKPDLRRVLREQGLDV